ncbi:hypothetical protein I6A84_33925, partial [Frankia sp. CNm7]
GARGVRGAPAEGAGAIAASHDGLVARGLAWRPGGRRLAQHAARVGFAVMYLATTALVANFVLLAMDRPDWPVLLGLLAVTVFLMFAAPISLGDLHERPPAAGALLKAAREQTRQSYGRGDTGQLAIVAALLGPSYVWDVDPELAPRLGVPDGRYGYQAPIPRPGATDSAPGGATSHAASGSSDDARGAAWMAILTALSDADRQDSGGGSCGSGCGGCG